MLPSCICRRHRLDPVGHGARGFRPTRLHFSEAEMLAMENPYSLACCSTQLVMNYKAYETEVGECKDSIFEGNKDDLEIFMDRIIKCWPWKQGGFWKRQTRDLRSYWEHRDRDRSPVQCVCLVKNIWEKRFRFELWSIHSRAQWSGMWGGEKENLVSSVEVDVVVVFVLCIGGGKLVFFLSFLIFCLSLTLRLCLISATVCSLRLRGTWQNTICIYFSFGERKSQI